MSKGLSESAGLTIVLLLLVLAFASVATLWTISSVGSSGESTFALYLAVDLVSFAMISYVYRTSKDGMTRRLPLLAGVVTIVLLVAAGFAA